MKRLRRRKSCRWRRRRWMRWAPVVAAVAGLAMAPPAGGGGVAEPPLKQVSPPHGGYRVDIPRTWRFVDASYPSDHSTHIWYDPANPLKRLIVVRSACAGCIAGITDFRRMSEAKIRSHLPGHPLRIWIDGPLRVRFLSYDTDPWNNVYPDNGLFLVGHDIGSFKSLPAIYVHLWLPQRERSTALRILKNFEPQ
jgi:hypothetical protein